MRLRIYMVCLLVLIIGSASATPYPNSILHTSYATQFYAVDSICNVICKDDSARCLQEFQQYEKWAEDNKDKPLMYAFIIRQYDYSFRLKDATPARIDPELTGLVKELEQRNMPELEAQALDLLYQYYTRTRRHTEALEASLEACNIVSKFSPEQFPLKYNVYANLAANYYHFKDYTSALPYYLADKNAEPKYMRRNMLELLNVIGLCYRRSGVYDSAEYYFKEAYDSAITGNRLDWKGITGGNLGITYYLEKRYKAAIPLLEDDINIGLKRNKLNDNEVNSIAVLGDVYLQLNDKKKGLALLLQAYQMVVDGSKWNRYETLESVYPRLARAYAMNGNYTLAYNFSDSATRVSDSSAAQKNALILASVEQKINNEKHNVDVVQHQREFKIQAMVWTFLLVSITSLLVALFFILRNYRNQKATNKLISREKKRSEDLLLNILPAEVAEELKDKGTADAKYFDHVTVMFTDFVNFTRASEHMNPQQLIDELHTCFKAFDEIISKYKIEKIKTIGDAYLAVSGLPVADPLHAQQVTLAAIDIRDFMHKRQLAMGDKTFSIRIGIHTGSVVAGIVGVIKFAYDIWGDTVNIAARMEQSSEEGKINISEATYELVKHKFSCSSRGKIQAKNKGEINMYFVDGIKQHRQEV